MTPHEAVAKALEQADHTDGGGKPEYGVLAIAAIKSLRKLARVNGTEISHSAREFQRKITIESFYQDLDILLDEVLGPKESE